MKIAVLLAEGFEEIEAVSLIDILRRAGYGVTTAATSGSLRVTGGHSIPVIADRLLVDGEDADSDMLLLPGGGKGVDSLSADARVLDLVRRYHTAGRHIAAICAAPFVLEKAGVLSGIRATAYPSLQSRLVSAKVVDEDVVVDGRFITSRGVGTAIQMALRIVEEFSGKGASMELARSMVC